MQDSDCFLREVISNAGLLLLFSRLRLNFPALVIMRLEHKAPYPSGKGEVCKTFMHRFESDRRLSIDSLWVRFVF